MNSSNPQPTASAREAVRALIAARDEARLQMHVFSNETWRSWRELDHEIDTKLEDAELRLNRGGLLAEETVSARAGELRSAVDALLRENLDRGVHGIMTTDVKTCRPEDTLDSAARTLWDADCGALPVVDASGKLVGMITDRDICMAAYTRNVAVSTCSVASAMARVVHSCSAATTVQGVAELMREHQVRRIPLTDPDGTLVGIVSIADVARHLDSLPDEHAARALLVPTLAAITRPRSG